MKIAADITELVGNTPIVKLNRISSRYGANIYGKCEFLNPTSSVKDRIALSMIKSALKSNKITSQTVVIEPTSGNTGIALASICAGLNIKLILTMPESMSLERRRILKALGADIVLTPKEKGMKGAVLKAEELGKEIKSSFLPQQFKNPANPKIHEETTGVEIWEDTDGKIDILVSAIGTGGTITGAGKFLKSKNPSIKVIAVEPKNSAVLSGCEPGLHKIQGIGAGFTPEVLDTNIYDEIIKVSDDDSFNAARRIAKYEGLLVGISSGANIYASMVVAQDNPNKNIVTILCDTGERYLSTPLYPYNEDSLS